MKHILWTCSFHLCWFSFFPLWDHWKGPTVGRVGLHYPIPPIISARSKKWSGLVLSLYILLRIHLSALISVFLNGNKISSNLPIINTISLNTGTVGYYNFLLAKKTWVLGFISCLNKGPHACIDNVRTELMVGCVVHSQRTKLLLLMIHDPRPLQYCLGVP